LFNKSVVVAVVACSVHLPISVPNNDREKEKKRERKERRNRALTYVNTLLLSRDGGRLVTGYGNEQTKWEDLTGPG